MIHLLGKTITYQVDQTLTVEPDDISSLSVDPEQDYCTLVTCTPYGINSHRLLVRGHRVPNEKKISKSSKKKTNVIPWIYISIILLVLIFILILLYVRRKKKRAELRLKTGLRSAVYRKQNKKGYHAK